MESLPLYGGTPRYEIIDIGEHVRNLKEFLRLSDSQYKKVYRLFVDEFRFMDNAMRPGMRQPMKGYTQRDVARFMDRQDKKLQEILSVRQYSHWVKNCNYDYRFYVMR